LLLAATAILAVAAATGAAGAGPAPGDCVTLPGPDAAGLWPAAQARSSPRRRLAVDPFALVSSADMLATLEELTAIGADALFRTSASRGESEAFDAVAGLLAGLEHLASLGLEVRREPFRTAIGQEVWEARLFLTVGGHEMEVPAHALQGHRDDLVRALRLDSDGLLNDTERDPIEVSGPPLLVRASSQLAALTGGAVSGRVVLLDYALVDRALLGTQEATARAERLLQLRPAAVVLITTFSNVRGESHGSFVGDLGAFTLAAAGPPLPTLYARIEDLGAAGVMSWSDLFAVQAVRLRWDADVVAPGASQNLVATIPGGDRSRAVILGAHLDSPNSPGALDDGSGSVTLLEVARVLDAARVRPPVDLVLCWFGSHERGIFGSAGFVSAHSELLDRSLAMQQVDCLSRPLDGFSADLYLETWPYGRFGDTRTPWPSYLAQAAAARGLSVLPLSSYGVVSDNSSFAAFDVPNANLIYMNPWDMDEVHYDGHLHDPYDTVALAAEEADTLAAMARVALAAALDTGREQPLLRVTPVADRRAVFVASHTEAPHMTPTGLTELGMALAWEGIDVDVVPYGQPVTAADLADADLVFALPVHDYPSPDGDASVYDEAWSDAEVDALEAYVERGGLLVLTNSNRRLKYLNYAYETNEDALDANLLATRFGVTWLAGALSGASAVVQSTHPLVRGMSSLALVEGNGVPFVAPGAQLLARAGSWPAASLLSRGNGEVLVLADLGILGAPPGQAPNLALWRNLARYVRTR
jgi:hypothetical protein